MKLSKDDVPAEVMKAALKLHADAMGVEFDGSDGVPEAVAYAYAAGRESAYTTDEIEWSCRMKDGRPAFASSFTEAGARRYAAEDPHTAVFKRRVGPWEKVADELQA